MAYKALYRTYRPQLFHEVVGQDAIVRMIQNAIANNKISHAYLMCGPRGTGKTTIARIFAKALNCDHRENLEPCDKCVSCHEISDSMSPDVIEIDAASNNGVDEIRNIRDKVGFLPSGAKYKIYIIDEVHMLSTGAFNALLKTLEEPPKHVVFILATTEPQKLPATIISRCQRFDFKYVSISEISRKIREVCSKEEIEISEEAVNAISESAEGGLRDALSILDQAISYAETQVTIEEVNVVTGNLSSDKLIELTTQFEEKDVNTALEIIDNLINMGKEVMKLVNGLLQFYRDMLLYKNVNSVMYTKYIFEKQSFQELAANLSPEKIFFFASSSKTLDFYIDVLSDALAKMKYSQNPRIYLEIGIVKMINVSREDLNFLNRIERLEQKVEHMPTGGSSEGELPDQEKVEMIAMKLEHVVNEFNKLELHKLKEKLDDFESRLASNQGVTTTSIDPSIVKDIDQIKETMLILKTSYSGLTSRLTNIEEATEQIDAVKVSLANVEKQSNKVDLTNILNDIKYLKEDVEGLQEVVKNLYQKAKTASSTVPEENHVIDASLQEKLNAIEKKLYEVISGELAGRQMAPLKKTKVSTNQIALFANDLTPIEEFKKTPVKEAVNFENLAREEKLVEEPIRVDQSTLVDSHTLNDKSEETIKVVPVEKPVVEEKPQAVEPKITIEQDIIRQEKPNSELVITKREKSSLFEQEKELFEKEMVHIRPTAPQEVKPVEEKHGEFANPSLKREEAVPEESPAKETQIEEEKANCYLSYDIKVLERIMHDARGEEARNDLKRIQKLWEVIDRSVSPSDIGIAETLHLGKIAAVGSKEMIVVYEDCPSCNRVMRPSFKRKSMKILYDLLGGIYQYIALPQSLWDKKRKEYVDQYTIGIKFPALSPFDQAMIEQLKIQDDYQDPKDDIVKNAVDFFGNDLVEFE